MDDNETPDTPERDETFRRRVERMRMEGAFRSPTGGVSTPGSSTQEVKEGENKLGNQTIARDIYERTAEGRYS